MIFSLQDVSYSYPDSEKKVLDGINFSVNQGDYIAILGANGSGKSTLARMMAGFFEPAEGKIISQKKLRNGIVFQQPKEQIVAGIVERDTAFGPQNLNMTKGEIELRTIECLSAVSLAHKAFSKTAELSLGQTQRLSFAGILALFPDTLILDEVTAMLDPAAKNGILEFVESWNKKNHTVIHVTHDLDEALAASRILILDKGKIFFDGTKTEFEKNEFAMEKIFGRKKCFTDFSDLKKTDAKNSAKEISLEVSSLSFSYKNFSVFSDVSFSLKKGTLTSLTGPSGCGKSTLFECLSGLKKISGGKIFCSSRPVLGLQESESSLFETYAADDVAFGAKNRGASGKELVHRVKSAMNLAGLDFAEFADRATFKLSGGEKRKLSVASLIALDAEILIFDEPTAGLDPSSRKKIISTLRALADSGKTVLFSTHRPEEAGAADENLTWENLTKKNSTEGILHEKNFSEENSADEILHGKNFSEKNSADEIQREKNLSEKNSAEEILRKKFSEKNSAELSELTQIKNARILEKFSAAASAFTPPAKIPPSAVSSLSAALKMILFILIFAVSVSSSSIPFCACMVLLNFLYALAAKFPFKKPLSAVAKLFPWILLFSVLGIFLFPVYESDTIFFAWKFLIVTKTKCLLFAASFLHSVCGIFCIGTFIFTTSEREIMDGLDAILSPLKIFKFPVRYVVLVVGIIFRFVPLLLDELSGIVKTQIIRGALAEAKGIKKIFAFIPIFVPLVLQTIRKAQCLAEALEARYFK